MLWFVPKIKSCSFSDSILADIVFLQQWYEVVASYLLEGPRPPRLATSHQDNSPAARLDPSVFRTKRTTHKAKHSKEQQAKEHMKAKDQTKDKHKEQPKEQMNSKEKEHVKGDNSSKEKETTKEQGVTATAREQLTLEQQNNVTMKDGKHNGVGSDQSNDQQTKDVVCKDSPADQETNGVNGTSKNEDDKATEEKSEVKEEVSNKKD